MPLALLEAMATGLAVVATDVGDVRHMVSPCNRPFVMPADDLPGVSVALDTLRRRTGVRATLGQRNRRRSLDNYDRDAMFARYDALWQGAINGTLAARSDRRAGPGGLKRPA